MTKMSWLAVILCSIGMLWGRALCDCPDGFTKHQNNCYVMLAVKASWAESQHYCETVGANLAVINDANEEQFIHGLLQRWHNLIQTSQIWIGGTDLVEEGVWVAPKTLEPLTYFNWAPNEPDDLTGQHCLAIFRSSQLDWDDNKCEVQNYPLCKRSAEVIEEIIG